MKTFNCSSISEAKKKESELRKKGYDVSRDGKKVTQHGIFLFEFKLRSKRD